MIIWKFIYRCHSKYHLFQNKNQQFQVTSYELFNCFIDISKSKTLKKDEVNHKMIEELMQKLKSENDEKKPQLKIPFLVKKLFRACYINNTGWIKNNVRFPTNDFIKFR